MRCFASMFPPHTHCLGCERGAALTRTAPRWGFPLEKCFAGNALLTSWAAESSRSLKHKQKAGAICGHDWVSTLNR